MNNEAFAFRCPKSPWIPLEVQPDGTLALAASAPPVLPPSAPSIASGAGGDDDASRAQLEDFAARQLAARGLARMPTPDDAERSRMNELRQLAGLPPR